MYTICINTHATLLLSVHPAGAQHTSHEWWEQHGQAPLPAGWRERERESMVQRSDSRGASRLRSPRGSSKMFDLRKNTGFALLIVWHGVMLHTA